MKKNFAIVTGASRGIGRSAAALAPGRLRLFILAAARTNRSALADLRKEIKETWGQECITVLGDIGREEFRNLPFFSSAGGSLSEGSGQ